MPARNALHRGRVAGGRPRTREKGQDRRLTNKEGRGGHHGERAAESTEPRTELFSSGGNGAQLARFVLEGLAAGLVASLVFGLAVFIVTSPAIAATPHTNGALFLKDEAGSRTATPLVFTDVRMSVTGIVNRVTRRAAIRQPDRRMARRRLHVPAAREGRRRSPAHEGGRARGRRHDQGARGSRGERYENAKSEGRKATLLDAGAAEHVHDERRATSGRATRSSSPSSTRRRCATTRARSGCASRWRSRRATRPAPTNPSPRPATASDASPRRSSRAATATCCRCTSRSTSTRALPCPRCRARTTPMNIEPRGDHRYRLTLQDGPVPAARDFELAWTPNVGAAPATALFTETKGGKTYALLMALPPPVAQVGGAHAAGGDVHHRHVGLDGRRVDGAGARRAGDGARPPAAGRPLQRDRVQLDHALALRRAGRRRCRRPCSARRQFVAGLRARGGTEMLPALEIALAGPRAGVDPAPGRVPDRRRGRQRRRDPQARAASASATAACSRSASAPRPTCSS